MSSLLTATLLLLSFVFPTVFGFNWSYPVAPRQCSNFTVNLTNINNDVVFPVKVLIVPVGPSPLTYEVRKVMEVTFPTNMTTVSFQLPYPTGSKFVGLVSDASGYQGSASTWTVASSDDATCFDATKNAVPTFTFSLSPTDLAECQDVRIYWSSDSVQGLPSFISVIPDGSFDPIPLGKIEAQAGLGMGFTWRPSVRASTNLIIVGGDNRGADAGGFISVIVSPGNPNRDATGGCPAPTATTSLIAATTSTTPSTSKNIGPISTGSPPNVGVVIGGVLGGVAALCLVFFIFYRLLRNEGESEVIVPFTQRHIPVAHHPDYYGDKLSGPSDLVPMLPQPQEGIVPQGTGEQLPMYIAYTGHSVNRDKRL